jgi:hypothetical protein
MDKKLSEFCFEQYRREKDNHHKEKKIFFSKEIRFLSALFFILNIISKVSCFQK